LGLSITARNGVRTDSQIPFILPSHKLLEVFQKVAEVFQRVAEKLLKKKSKIAVCIRSRSKVQFFLFFSSFIWSDVKKYSSGPGCSKREKRYPPDKSTNQRITWFVLLKFIYWRANYPVDSVIQPLNN